MKIVNRGYIVVRPTKLFWDWANQFEDDLEFSVEDGLEPNIYLIEEEFFDIEPIIEQNFKKIYKNELSMITEADSDWPQDRSMETFLAWFDLEIGSSVFDLEKDNLRTEKVN